MKASAKRRAAEPMAADIQVRHCETLAEYDECVRMERLTWGEHITVPSAIFVVAHHTGGQILGAFDAGKMVGFTLALAGMRDGKPFLHSHMTAVLPEYQNRGVGRRLKLFQRAEALKNGVRLVEWTFDPLELKNAHFNLNRLGAVVRRHIPNCYGVTESPLHAGLPTDRLVAEWWLDSERVRGVLANGALPRGKKSERVLIPGNVSTLKAKDREAGARIQTQTREAFQEFLDQGYVLTGIEMREGIAEYILEPAASIRGLAFAGKAGGRARGLRRK